MFILEDSQKQAVEKIGLWYNSDSGPQNPFVLAGLAGTGKTTIIKYFIDQMAISASSVRFVAFTGKASLVMTRMGTPATTIHKLIYKVVEDEETHEISFERNAELDSSIRLIVVDEASMVSEEIQKDLESFGVPIIYIGDHGQLPPVSGVSNLMQNPHVKLEKIHRQAEGNPIIQLAKLARLGAKIPYKHYSESVCKISMKDVTPSMMLSVEQILCGKNVTRAKLNQKVRHLLGRREPEVENGDKVIFLRNNWHKGYVNGMTGNVTDLYPFDKKKHADPADWWGFPQGQMAMTFKSDVSDDTFFNVPYDAAIFTGEKSPDLKNRLVEALDYAYAITVHKAQGSQYQTAMVIEEWLGDLNVHKKWLYTAITRAACGLILVGR